MGSRPSEPKRTSYEGPRHEVTLAPFFLSKFEVTQAQWRRLTCDMPSDTGPHVYLPKWDRLPAHSKQLWLHPVEMVSWNESVRILGRLGLMLPTEAQWEYAARAGSTTTWWTGEDKATLQGAENLGDSFYLRFGAAPGAEEDLDDGFAVHAPVGSFRGNAFGLHDMTGNVAEWCRDLSVPYGGPVNPGDGERYASDAAANQGRALRGAHYGNSALHARPAIRFSKAPESREQRSGCARAASSRSDLPKGRIDRE